MNIGSGQSYPANSLSNFAPHPFTIDGVECASMEGFLQSLKFKNQLIQKEICKLVGRSAKRAGKHKNWQRTQTLWWKGKPYPRVSKEYQSLLDRAFDALTQNEKFRNALLASGASTLQHTMGRGTKSETVLTRGEFCGRLMKIRARLWAEWEQNTKDS